MLLHAKTRYGKVQGTPSSVAGVAVFRGVPYAKPPVGALRWRAPEKPEAWNGVLQCEKFQAAAMQTKATMPFYVKEFPIDYSQIAIHEDCLYLNIWTPAASASDNLPVMVYFHGGGDVTGFPHEPEHDGARLAEKQVIYVNVTYRLNVFGFLAHPELTAESGYGASGNYGLLDQVAALKWIQENIEAFGGNPDAVTIFGQSAGAGNVHAHCVSPLTKGLFRRRRRFPDAGRYAAGRRTEGACFSESLLLQFAKRTSGYSGGDGSGIYGAKPHELRLLHRQLLSVRGALCGDHSWPPS